MFPNISNEELGCKGNVVEQVLNVETFPALGTMTQDAIKDSGRQGVGCTHGCPAAEICAKRALVEKYREEGTKRLIAVSVTVFPGS